MPEERSMPEEQKMPLEQSMPEEEDEFWTMHQSMLRLQTELRACRQSQKKVC